MKSRLRLFDVFRPKRSSFMGDVFSTLFDLSEWITYKNFIMESLLIILVHFRLLIREFRHGKIPK